MRRRLDELDPARADSERRHRRRRRRRRLAAIVAAVLVAIGGIWFATGVADLASDAAEPPADLRIGRGVEIEVPGLAATFPTEPTYDRRVDVVDGDPVTMDNWFVENDDVFLQVLRYQMPVLAEVAADAEYGEVAIDVVVGGVARAVDGDVVSSESIDVAGTLAARRSEVVTNDGHIFLEVYARADDVVVAAGSDYSDEPPTEFDDLLASIELR